MKREKIKGFTLRAFGYYLEFVFINYLLNVVSLSKPLNKTLVRFEK
jgi:hypothetical protein